MEDDHARHALFVYGSLQVDEVMEAVTGRRFSGRPAILPGHRRRLLVGRSYPGVVPDPGESTPGIVFEGLASDDLEILDLFEGEPYERRVAPLDRARPGEPGERGRAFVYVVRDTHASLLTEALWDLETFRTRSLARFLEQCRAFRRDALRGVLGQRPA